MSKIIGISGLARVGKDTVADYLEDAYDYHKFSFAYPVYQAVEAFFGIKIEDHIDTKEEKIPYWGLSLREMLQVVGTECGRDIIDPDIWVKNLKYRIDKVPNNKIVIPDIRFNNEADFVRSHGVLIHITRTDAIKVNPHRSEGGVVSKTSDFHIVNSSTLDDLYHSVDNIMSNL